MTYSEIRKNEEVLAFIKKGNAVNRSHHAEYGALLANDILKKTDLPPGGPGADRVRYRIA